MAIPNAREKLEKLCEIEGKEEMAMLEEASFDSMTPGICINEGCDYSDETEPDSDSGYCENCNTNTVCSCLVLAGII